MQMTRTIPVALAVAATLLLPASLTHAGKGGGGKGGGGGGGDGGGDPPAPLVITYVSNGDLMACAADGSNETLLLEGTHGRPSWSPDGTMIAFGSESLSPAGIYTYEMGTGDVALVAELNVAETKVAWAPAAVGDDGYVIAYQDTPAGDTEPDIFLAALDGTTTNLTGTSGVAERHPTWSPDARKMAYSRSTTRDTGLPTGYLDDELVVLNVDVVNGAPSKGDELVISEVADSPLVGEDVRQPSWSKDGTRLIVKSGGASGWSGDFWVVDLSSPATPTNVTAGFSQSTLVPCWSSDDSTIVYMGSNDIWSSGGSLFTLDLASGTTTEIVRRGRGKTTAFRHHPDWQR